jgi:hypothetical protein
VVELDESGVTWVRAAAVPYLEAQSGGTMVRGREEPGSDVLITARRGALEIGSAGVVADATGAYTVVLQTAPGMVLARGDQVTAVGRPPAVVAPLSLSLDEGAARATGSTGGGESVELAFTDVDGDSLGRSVVTAGGDGAYDGPVGAPAPLAPGILGEAVVAGEAWGRTFALDYVPRLVVRIGSSTVRGLADPFGEVAVTAGAPGGQATGTALADTRGQWEAELVGGGSPVAVQPGWQVHVVSEGGPDVDLEVPAFGVRLLDKGLITGWAPPSAEVRIRLTGPGGVSFEAGTRAGLDGTWVLRESELSGAVPFPLTQTTAALASIDVRGHRVEAHTDESPEATPTPTSRPQPGSPTATRTSGATPTATPTSRTRTPTATGTATGHRPVVPSLFVPSVRAP